MIWLKVELPSGTKDIVQWSGNQLNLREIRKEYALTGGKGKPVKIYKSRVGFMSEELTRELKEHMPSTRFGD